MLEYIVAMSSKIDVESYQGEIGTVWEYEIGQVTRQQVRRYARAVEDDNPLFHDVEHAVSEGFDDLVIPPNFLPAVIDPGEGVPADQLREDGLDPSRYPIDIPPKAALMGGGQSLTFDRYLTAGESIVVNERFDDIYQKESSSMGLLTFLETTTEYLTASGECAIECEKTTIVADRQ